MRREHTRLHRSYAALAPPRRFQLLMLLLSGVDRSVSQLARAVRLSQSCTTRHLQSLERAGLVKRERDGKRVVFRPAPRDAAAREVLASLAHSADAFEAGLAREAIPVASTAELEPLMCEPAEAGLAESVAAALGQPPATPEPSSTHEPPESGNTSDSRALASRYRTDIEDYLL